MIRTAVRRTLFTVAMVAVSLAAGRSFGQITSIMSSDVEGFFGSQSDGFQQSEGPIFPTWAASPYPSYPLYTGAPNVPAIYGGFPNPILPIPSNISFQTPSGHAPSSPFTDGQTTADYTLFGGYLGAGTQTSDAFVNVGPPGSVGMFLKQPPSATGYAYEQAHFAIDYGVGSAGLTAGNTGPRPMWVFGNVVPGGSAQFGAQVNYWWIPIIPGTIIPSGAPTLLGQLQYSFTTTSSSFSALVPSVVASRSMLATPGGVGILELTGDVFVAGDPFQITVQSVPEPSSIALAFCGTAGLAVAAWRRRRTR